MKRFFRDNSGFTLTELLVVIAMIAILMGMISTGLLQARRNAKRAKAEAELRSLVSAWGQWFQLYGPDTDYEWPGAVDGQTDIDMDANNLGPVIDASNSDNPKGIVFLNASIERTGKNPDRKYLDPWGNPYRMDFDTSAKDLGSVFKITSSVYLPNRDMLLP